MGEKTGIAWTDSTLNLCWGCTKVSAGCANCYMYRISPRFGRDASKVVLTRSGASPGVAHATIRRMGRRVFVNSMSDTFHRDIDDRTLESWFHTFEEFAYDHDFQILTKRPLRMLNFQRDYYPDGFHHNIWAGTSVESAAFRGRIDILRRIKANVRFVSFEPLIGDAGRLDLSGIQWAIIGGESGQDPRPMKPEWAASIIGQAHTQGVPVFFKQLGGKGGGGAGGDTLDGLQYHEFPSVPSILITNAGGEG